MSIGKIEFEKQWGDHINDLFGLDWNLEVEDGRKLAKHIKGLKMLAKKASDRKFKNDCIHCGSVLVLSDYGTMICESCEEPQHLMV